MTLFSQAEARFFVGVLAPATVLLLNACAIQLTEASLQPTLVATASPAWAAWAAQTPRGSPQPLRRRGEGHAHSQGHPEPKAFGYANLVTHGDPEAHPYLNTGGGANPWACRNAGADAGR